VWVHPDVTRILKKENGAQPVDCAPRAEGG
jgi:hypothetical protein